MTIQSDVEFVIRTHYVEGQVFTADDIVGYLPELTRKQVSQGVSSIRQKDGLPLHVVGHCKYVLDSSRPISLAGKRGRAVKHENPKLDCIFEIVGEFVDGRFLIKDCDGYNFVATLEPLN